MARNDDLRAAQVGTTAVSTAAAAGLSFIPGIGPALGGMVGAFGGAISAALGLGMDPNLPEIPPEQLQSAGLGAEALAQLSAQTGMGAREVAQLEQVGRGQRATETMMANTLARQLSPYDRKRVTDRLLQTQMDVNKSIVEKIQMLDPVAETNRLRSVVTGSAQISQQYAQIAKQQMQKQLFEDEYKKNMTEAFTATISKLASGIGTFTDQYNQNSEEEKKREAAKAQTEADWERSSGKRGPLGQLMPKAVNPLDEMTMQDPFEMY